MQIRKATGLLCLPVLLLAGCAARKYHAAPVSPAENAASLESRSLADPGLKQYAEKKLGSGSAPWPPKAWNLNDLTLAAFYYSPDLAIARARLEAAEGGVTTAGARPNPTIRVAPGTTSAPESPWLYGFSFDLPIETAGKRGYRIQRAKHLSDAARLDLANLAWKVRSAVRAALVDHLLATRELEIVTEQEQVLSERVRLLRARLAAGEIPRPEVDAAEIELANTRLALRAAEGRVATSRAALAAAIGVPVSALEGVEFAWPDFDRPPSALSTGAIQREAVLNRLDVRRALAEYAAADAGLRLELAKQYPDLTLGPAYDFDGGENKFTLGAGLTLPLFNRNQGPIAEAEARRTEAGARVLATQARVIAESERALAQYRAAERELAEGGQTLTRLQSAQVQFAQRAVQLGESDRLALNSALLQSTAAARARLDALRRVQVALGALEDALQRPLAPAVTLPQLTSIHPQAPIGKEVRK